MSAETNADCHESVCHADALVNWATAQPSHLPLCSHCQQKYYLKLDDTRGSKDLVLKLQWRSSNTSCTCTLCPHRWNYPAQCFHHHYTHNIFQSEAWIIVYFQSYLLSHCTHYSKCDLSHTHTHTHVYRIMATWARVKGPSVFLQLST